MKQNNKGFSLIELIVATAILGIVVIGAGGFMVSGANSFRSVFTNVSLQYTAQQAMNQMQGTLLDCDTAIYAAGDALYAADRQADGTYRVYAYTVMDQELRFQRADNVIDSTDAAMVSGSQQHRAAPDVTDLWISVDKDPATGKGLAATYTLSLARQGKTYTSTQTVALRNKPVVPNSLDELIAVCK